MDLITNGVLGGKMPVMDARLKVTGQLRYVDDLRLQGMLYAAVLFSPVAHARIVSIDASEAEQLPGVRAVVWYKDAPEVRYNGNGEDSSILPSERVFDDVVRYVGDKVAAVAAESLDIARKAVRLIHVDYQPLPAYFDPIRAVQPDAYPIHGTSNILEEVKLSAGNLDEGFALADHIFKDEYKVPAIHHAAMEPHGSIASYDADGKLTVYTPSQDVFGQRMNLAKIFCMPMSKVRVLSPGMGGGFGGKIDLVTEPITSLLAIKTGCPVKLVYTRREDISSSTTRHAETIFIKTGVKDDGTITACEYTVYAGAGAQSGATMSVMWAAGGKFFKIYAIPNLSYHAVPVYTNCSVAGAMRGFGSPQLFYALNSHLNHISMALGIDMCHLQLRNLHNPNTKDRHGEPIGNFRAKDCVRRGMELFGWDAAKHEEEVSRKACGRYLVGVGMAVAPHGSSLYGIMPDTCGVMLKMNEDGSLTMFTGVSEMGNGSNTIQMLLVSEVLGISSEKIACVKTDTETTLFDVGAYASRGTYVGGGAAVQAAKAMKKKILREASLLLSADPKQLVPSKNCVWVAGSERHVTMKQVAEKAHEMERDLVVAEVFGTKAAPISAGAHFVKVQVDRETGEVKVLQYVAVHDVGKPLNTMSLEGQVAGGIQMGLGYALSEGLELDGHGRVRNTRLRDCHLFTSTQMPKIVIEFLDSYEPTGPFGAKSVGECATVPAAGAVANAVSNAVGYCFNQLPIKKECILAHLQKKESL
ncbi:MAG: molybdopterin-dependent oxidoreductase [Spirochaetia bacterium]|jgi:CO/xanthine dehydrogenase Mo-binding subunit|nr:molybdopterin-dependent oxidoreductase [Spirochaetia bacterium]